MSTVLERQPLEMHENIMWGIIKRQAGTPEKGVGEGVQNTVDAKAKRCDVHVTSSSLHVSDDGQGFRSVEEVRKWFGTFGQPHEANEDKVYGTFRMGRGQLFAFGKNTWRTGTFEMVVDIQNEGLNYQLTTDLPFVQGCQISVELYDEMSTSDVYRCKNNLQKWLRYAPIPVYLNDELITIDPKTEKWDAITPEAYVRLNNGDGGGLEVHNLGVHVLTFPSYNFGAGGVVVSRKQLKVNFARNDVQSDCPVWDVVKRMIDKITSKRLVKTKMLNSTGRKRIVDKLLSDTLRYSDVAEAKIITAVTGRHYTVDELLACRAVTVARDGDCRGDSLHRQGTTFVLAQSTLERFNVSRLSNLMERLETITGRYACSQIRQVDYYEAVSLMKEGFERLPTSKLNKSEKIWLDLLRGLVQRQPRWAAAMRGRVLSVGDSEANAWTDAATYITFSRRFLSKRKFDEVGIGEVLRVLLHECCHVTPDNECHDHDQEFYESFHDKAGLIATGTYAIMHKLPDVMAKFDRKASKAVLAREARCEAFDIAAKVISDELVQEGLAEPV